MPKTPLRPASLKKQPEKIFCINENRLFEFLKTIIIGYNVQKKQLFTTCYIQPEQKANKKNKELFKELIKNFGTDCTRLFAIDSNQEITDHEQFVSKLRNEARFVHQHAYEKK